MNANAAVSATPKSALPGEISAHLHRFYIDGEWVEASSPATAEVIDPATEEVVATIALADVVDVDAAVSAARRAFASFSRTTPEERLRLLRRVLALYEARRDEFADAMTVEMGAPISLSRTSQAGLGSAQLQRTIDALEVFAFEESRGTTMIVKEATGVAALITPWNWPVNQIFAKFAAAFAAGCTMVVKPSEVSPLDALLFAEIVDDAGVAPGVFNLINGEGRVAGAALVSHPDVDVVSFTGSTRAGIEISKAAAEGVKTVHLELGGKSPNVILDDADLETAVTKGVHACFSNAGQSCSVATRMLVPRDRLAEAAEIARSVAEAYVVGEPTDRSTTMGPLANRKQFDHVQNLIRAGLDEGAVLVTGGLGRPDGRDQGYYVKPTVFSNVANSMAIAQTEIFGPVLCIIGYETEENAIEIANDSDYGLAAVVQSADPARARRVAGRLRVGHVYVNHEFADYAGAPFGGRKLSGHGYEHGEWGIEGFVSIKAMLGAV